MYYIFIYILCGRCLPMVCYIYAYIYIYIYIYIHTYIYIYVYIYLFIHTHTHIHILCGRRLPYEWLVIFSLWRCIRDDVVIKSLTTMVSFHTIGRRLPMVSFVQRKWWQRNTKRSALPGHKPSLWQYLLVTRFGMVRKKLVNHVRGPENFQYNVMHPRDLWRVARRDPRS